MPSEFPESFEFFVRHQNLACASGDSFRPAQVFVLVRTG